MLDGKLWINVVYKLLEYLAKINKKWIRIKDKYVDISI